MRSWFRAAVPAALLLAAGLAGPARAEGGASDPYVVAMNPLKTGLGDWTVEGNAKAFSWNADEGVVAVKGMSGKPAPRAFFRLRAWPHFSAEFRVKKGASKPRVLLLPDGAGAEAVGIEIPRKALGTAAWSDVVFRVEGGRAFFLLGEEELPGADLPAGVRWRFGFEAPSGTTASFAGLRLVRRYNNPPQVKEEGFTSLFDGASLGGLRPIVPGEKGGDPARHWSVKDGLLVGEVRDGGASFLLLGDGKKSFEVRFTALWGSTAVHLRVVEIPSKEQGKINTFDSITANLTDYLDPMEMPECSVRVAEGKCVVTVGGKVVFDQKHAEFATTPVYFVVGNGQKTIVRDLRIRDL
jgi:hypothetical protein